MGINREMDICFLPTGYCIRVLGKVCLFIFPINISNGLGENNYRYRAEHK